MQNKVGEHIVNIATTILILGFSASILTFLVLIGRDIDNFGRGLLIAALGCLGSWVSFLFLSGFGLLIANTTKTVELLTQIQAASKPSGGAPQKAAPITTVSEKKAEVDENKEAPDTNEQENRPAKPNADYSDDDIYKIVDESELTEEEKRNVKELIAWKNDGVISAQECRNRVSKILSNYSIAIQFRFLNKL